MLLIMMSEPLFERENIIPLEEPETPEVNSTRSFLGAVDNVRVDEVLPTPQQHR